VSEGSIAVSRISLTIASTTSTGVRFNVIPETWQRTTLQHRQAGDEVNIEVDLLARYVERLLTGTGQATRKSQPALRPELLMQWGYGG
jgi:riboflavin synthase